MSSKILLFTSRFSLNLLHKIIGNQIKSNHRASVSGGPFPGTVAMPLDEPLANCFFSRLSCFLSKILLEPSCPASAGGSFAGAGLRVFSQRLQRRHWRAGGGVEMEKARLQSCRPTWSAFCSCEISIECNLLDWFAFAHQALKISCRSALAFDSRFSHKILNAHNPRRQNRNAKFYTWEVIVKYRKPSRIQVTKQWAFSKQGEGLDCSQSLLFCASGKESLS